MRRAPARVAAAESVLSLADVEEFVWWTGLVAAFSTMG